MQLRGTLPPAAGLAHGAVRRCKSRGVRSAESLSLMIVTIVDCKIRRRVSNLSKEGGSIVFFSSVAGSFGEVGKSTYGMTKAALLNLAKHLACELARKNVRINSISPGAICTPINMNLPHMKDPEKRAALEAQHLLGLGETSDIANACIYLLSDASRWVTGTNLFVDGGYSVR